jgi:hypothetical protein
MWLLKITKDDTTFQKTYETLTQALKYIHQNQNAYQYHLIYLDPNN